MNAYIRSDAWCDEVADRTSPDAIDDAAHDMMIDLDEAERFIEEEWVDGVDALVGELLVRGLPTPGSDSAKKCETILADIKGEFEVWAYAEQGRTI